MRYKVSIVKVHTNKWGRILWWKGFSKEFNSLGRAKVEAISISRKFKTYDVIVYDTQGPKLDEDDVKVEGTTTWLVESFKRGISLGENEDYLTANR